MDKTGKVIAPPIFLAISKDFKDGFARVEVDFGKPFYINKQGKCVASCENAPKDYPRGDL